MNSYFLFAQFMLNRVINVIDFPNYQDSTTNNVRKYSLSSVLDQIEHAFSATHSPDISFTNWKVYQNLCHTVKRFTVKKNKKKGSL